MSVLEVELGEVRQIVAELRDELGEDQLLVEVVEHWLICARQDLGDELLPDADGV